MRHDPEVQQNADLYQFGLPHLPVAGRSGELLGRGVGSSLEFQEYREYMPGDDIRHLDWAAYARSDALMVRLYREEISPQTEILLDASRSMATGQPAKPRVTKQLAALFALLSGHLGGRPSILPLDDARAPQRLGLENLHLLERMEFTSKRTMADHFQEQHLPLKRQAVRIVISDFLFPHDPASLIRQVAAGASALWVVQVLSSFEAAPEPLGGRRLVDVETSQEHDLLVDKKTVAAYRERLARLQEELARNCRRVHATFVTLVADRGLNALCRDDLCAAGILRPA